MDAIDYARPSLLTARRHAPPAGRYLAAAAFLLVASAVPATAERNVPFLRTDDSRLAAALVRGGDQSPTFRAIVDRLRASDLIVYVSRGSLSGQAAAFTQLLSSTGGYRYVLVTMELDPDTDVGVAMLGHELRHALELADAPWVVDNGAVLSLYREIGYSSCTRPARCYDTQDAVNAGRRVLTELRRYANRPPEGRAIERWLDALGLPVALRKEPGAEDRQRDERNADRNERPGWAEAGAAGQKPGQRDFP
jgi:hypothetical protein